MRTSKSIAEFKDTYDFRHLVHSTNQISFLPLNQRIQKILFIDCVERVFWEWVKGDVVINLGNTIEISNELMVILLVYNRRHHFKVSTLYDCCNNA